jgi:hypothetical protein
MDFFVQMLIFYAYSYFFPLHLLFPTRYEHAQPRMTFIRTYIARQRLGKHIPAEVYSRNNRMTIARQRISKQAFSTIERPCFLRRPYRGVIKGRKKELSGE